MLHSTDVHHNYKSTRSVLDCSFWLCGGDSWALSGFLLKPRQWISCHVRVFAESRQSNQHLWLAFLLSDISNLVNQVVSGVVMYGLLFQLFLSPLWCFVDEIRNHMLSVQVRCLPSTKFSTMNTGLNLGFLKSIGAPHLHWNLSSGSHWFLSSRSTQRWCWEAKCSSLHCSTSSRACCSPYCFPSLPYSCFIELHASCWRWWFHPFLLHLYLAHPCTSLHFLNSVRPLTTEMLSDQ